MDILYLHFWAMGMGWVWYGCTQIFGNLECEMGVETQNFWFPHSTYSDCPKILLPLPNSIKLYPNCIGVSVWFKNCLAQTQFSKKKLK
jgi:hypothetical protein